MEQVLIEIFGTLGLGKNAFYQGLDMYCGRVNAITGYKFNFKAADKEKDIAQFECNGKTFFLKVNKRVVGDHESIESIEIAE